MKRIYLTTLTTIALTSLALAQAPVPPPAATPPAGGEKKVRPLSQSDVKAVQVFAEALLFQMKLGEVGKNRQDKDKALSEMSGKIHEEAKAQWTPMVSIAQTHQMDGKNIPADVTKNDKSNMDKLGKVKDDKYSVEFLELFAKEAKRNAKSAESAAKGINDAELKTWAEGAAKFLATQADELEAAHKEAKKKK